MNELYAFLGGVITMIIPKLLERFLQRNKERFDQTEALEKREFEEQALLRKELREELAITKAELRDAEIAVISWREKYYELQVRYHQVLRVPPPNEHPGSEEGGSS